jgi:hypothetical protein
MVPPLKVFRPFLWAVELSQRGAKLLFHLPMDQSAIGWRNDSADSFGWFDLLWGVSTLTKGSICLVWLPMMLLKEYVVAHVAHPRMLFILTFPIR